ncbi:hypothetical protein TIFTF001_053788 [Ficus carica]|uniref:Protein BIG GRAIN 1-like A n=1 Tax=Ficus carica TaxID=3494 RepID=A0AA88JGW1_FICCA|nr:hypothetical protein TIFTF001_053788 [Ficus carica]
MQKMYRFEKSLQREEGGRYRHEKEIPSFSSSLLDKIYRSIDDGEKKSEDLKFFRETMTRKHSKTSRVMEEKEEEEEEMSSFRRACLIEKWMGKKVGEKVGAQGRKYCSEFDRKLDHDNDALFFSSTSSSSDSSSGGFSSSDTESFHGARSASSLYPAPARPKPVRTSVTEKKQSALFYERREELHVFDAYRRPKESHTPKLDDGDVLIKSKSRALKIYSNLKKVKQPISPGGKLASFLNSLFTNSTKKTKSYNTTSSYQETSTCSSASSFSRSCLSKNSPSTREKLRNNGVKRSVRFYPVSVIVDEDSRPCGHKCLYEEQDSALMPVSVPTAWKIGRSPVRKTLEDELKVRQQVLEKTRRVEGTAREFLRDYHQNQTNKKDFIPQLRGEDDRIRRNEEVDDEEFDDAASYSSSDLFELDHLAVIGKEMRYQEELPVYETTRVDKNRAIANGLIM